MDCPFCTPDPPTLLASSPNGAAICDRYPVAPGHALMHALADLAVQKGGDTSKKKLIPMPTIEVRTGDITTFEVDAIVNAANTQLAPGGGVCGAIHAAAGPELAEACAEVAPCPTGEARITGGFGLPARFVIHAVGPVWKGGAHGEPLLLASAYRAALELAEEEPGVVSVALPAISTGVYGYPLQAAAEIAVAEARAMQSRAKKLARIVFVAFTEGARAAFEEALSALGEGTGGLTFRQSSGSRKQGIPASLSPRERQARTPGDGRSSRRRALLIRGGTGFLPGEFFVEYGDGA